MNYSDIKYTDMINGEGIRVSIFVSGCSHKCKGCFNKDTWNPEFGRSFSNEVEEEILKYFEQYRASLKGLSLLGGDPTFHKNIAPLISFLKKFKKRFPEKTIWIWSGFTWEAILESEKLFSLVSLCDVLIDGKFIEEKKDLTLKWRGSQNQRVIDIQKSISENSVILYEKIGF